jgi:hypothetical protein
VASAKAARARVIVRDWLGYTTIRFRSELKTGIRSSRDAVRPGRPEAGSRRMRLRQWRRSRPFWGGLLLIFAGVELIMIPLSGLLLHGAIKLVIYIGIGGVFGVLIGTLLIVCGVLLWLTPAHRTFYAVAGVLLAVLSFITSNLGGFFLGMLLGITGGSLAFGWTPGMPGEAPADESRADDERQSGRHGGSTGRLASAALPAVLLGALLSGHAAVPHQMSQPHRTQGCILGILCWPSQPSQSPLPPLLPVPPPVPSPSTSPGGVTVQPTPIPSGSAVPRAKIAAGPDGVAAALATSVITADSATLDGLAYQGTANVPVAGGTQKMMKFTLNSLTLTGNVTATVTEDGQTTVTQNSSLAFSGGVTLYATKLSGSLLGIPVTLTPGNVISILLHVLNTVTPLVPVTMTNVTTDQPLVFAAALQATNLNIMV